MKKCSKKIHLVCGMGEVGKGLREVLMKDKKNEIVPIDIDCIYSGGDVYAIHICFPYNRSFVSNVIGYVVKYKPKVVIIHSSVPVGTTRSVSYDAVHSPIRGRHPHLAEGIQTFTKYFGSTCIKSSVEASKIFEKCGVNVVVAPNPETTELAKIMCTTDLGWQVIFEKEFKRLCGKYAVDFSIAYTSFRNTYNSGYTKLGSKQFNKPVLDHNKGEIGGHCVLPNLEFLDSPIAKIIKKMNKKLKGVQ